MLSSTEDFVDVTPLKGEVCEQYIRCGKAGCRCRDGHLHGPYHYRIWREGTRVRKVYVRDADLASVQRACAAYKFYAAALREQRSRRAQLTQHINHAWRRTRTLQQAKPRTKLAPTD